MTGTNPPTRTRRILFSLLALATLAQAASAGCPIPALTEKTAIPVGVEPRSIALADFDKDGNLDMATTQTPNGAELLVQYGNGDGTFGTAVRYQDGDFSLRVIAADFNNDTWTDLLVLSYGPHFVAVFPNNGDGTFGEVQGFVAPTGASEVSVGDANDDGNLDVAVRSNSGYGIYYGNGDFTFTDPHPLAAPGAPAFIALGDVNGDGLTDAAVLNDGFPATSSFVEVFFRDESGAYPTTKTLPVPGETFGSLALADVSGDGIADIISVNEQLASASVFVSNGDDTFAPRVDYPLGQTVLQVRVADITEDGIPDLVFGALNATAVPVLVGNGDGTFQPVQATPFANQDHVHQAEGIAIGDVNNDYRPDVVVTDWNENTVHVFLSGCTPRYAATALDSSPNPSVPGETVALTATVTVAGPVHPTGTVSFYEGATLLGSAPLSPTTSTASITITPAVGTHSYTATYSGDSEFGASTSSPHSHTVNPPPFGTPPAFSATGNPATGQVALQWSATQDVDHYEIWRMTGGTWAVIGTTSNTTFTNTLGPNASAFYRVRAFNVDSDATDYAVDAASTVPFTYPSLGPGSVIHAADITDLRTIVNQLRTAAGLGAFTFTDPSLTGVVIKAAHLNELRTAFAEATTYSRPITAGLTVLANDVVEMRAKVR